MAGRNQVTLTFAGDSKNLERSLDRVGAASKQMASTVQEQGGGLQDLGTRMEDVGKQGDNLENSSEGVAYSMRGLAGLLGADLNPQMLLLLEGGENLGGGIKRLLPQIGAAVAAFRALSLAKQAAIAGAAGLAVGLGALALSQRSSGDEASTATEKWDKFATTLKTEVAPAITVVGDGLSSIAADSRSYIKVIEDQERAEKILKQAIEDGNAALVERIANSGVLSRDKTDGVIDKIAESERRANEERERTEELIGDTRTANERYKDALEEVEKSQRDVAAAERTRENALKAVEQSVQRVADAEKNLAAARKDLAELIRDGADGLSPYEEALKRVENADKRVTEAEGGLADSHRKVETATRNVEQAVKDVTRAEEELVKAHDRIRAAQEKVADAEQKIADIRAKALESAEDSTLDIAKNQNAITKANAALAKAETKLAQLRAGAETTAAGLQEAEQEVADAKLDVAIASEALGDSQVALNTATKTLEGTSKEARTAEENRKTAVDNLAIALRGEKDAQDALIASRDAVVGAENAKRDAVYGVVNAETALRDRIRERNHEQGVAHSLDDTDVKFADAVRDARKKVEDANRNLTGAIRDQAAAYRELRTATDAASVAQAGLNTNRERMRNLTLTPAMFGGPGFVGAGMPGTTLPSAPHAAPVGGNTNNITVNLSSNANPHEIANAITWAMKTQGV